MPLNPLQFTEQVLADFLRYQVTAYPLAADRLSAQLRAHLALGQTRRSPLVRGPYVSLSRAFAEGASVQSLVDEGVLHPHVARLAPFPDLYGHQERAIRAIAAGRTTLVSTGTGSGKTECFLYPIVSRCLELRDQNAPPGIVAVLVYPMNALAIDQLGRMRGVLAGSGISFGLYVGSTPERDDDVPGERLRAGASQADYLAALDRAKREGRSVAVHPPEERVSREKMRAPGGPPRILLTNVKQLELLLTRQADVQLFDGGRLDYLVFDEAHTWSGAEGAEAACLVRRLRSFCGRGPEETVCVGTSATLADPVHGFEPARDFAGRFFGVARDRVEVVTESYRGDEWASRREWPPAPSLPSVEHLAEILAALDAAEPDAAAVGAAYQALTGRALPEGDWRESLFADLTASALCHAAAETLGRPMALDGVVERLTAAAGREVTAEEALCWLVLGAASRRDGRPLMRPVVHAFVRGMGGAVVTFEPGDPAPRLAMLTADGSGAPAERAKLALLSCTTCGQHYFEHYVADLKVAETGLEGGDAAGESRVWKPLDRALGGARVVLLDTLIGADEEDDEDPDHTWPVHLCAFCGALHPEAGERCASCGREGKLVSLLAVVTKEKRRGRLTSCLSCRAPGSERPGQWREPARPVRAVTVADVHVLAQNIVHRTDGGASGGSRRRLLVFADNRQDAAFQAGWMRDHARRFRIRSLMMERIEQGAVSVGDLVHHLDRTLDGDDELSRALLPEVWNHVRKEAGGTEHDRERIWFLRVLVLRELATGIKQRLGLEPWGRLCVRYLGLGPDVAFVREWSARLGLAPERLVDGIAALLDTYRRSSFLIYDEDTGVFTRFWDDGARERQRGYVPRLRGVPKGLKLQYAADDDRGRLDQWLSERGENRARQIVRKFGVTKDDVDGFLTGLWTLLTEELRLLRPVTLKGQRGGALPRCSGARQLDGGRLIIEPHRGRWRCQRCRRMQVRPSPHDRCLAWRCDGTLVPLADDPDDYDLLALDQKFALLRPAEHSAQVPNEERERLERWFKGEGEQVNTLVCTPTLEMGVDIGGLDSVLLRNVPPSPANYWQRVGRAGRRHRLAVNLTYARDTSHDRQHFAEPLKLLEGRVEPPRFNLRNEVMVGKHVRAAVITRLRQLAREGGGLGEHDREEIRQALDRVLPTFVRGYLIEVDGSYRRSAFDVGALHTVVTKHEAELCRTVERVFRETWPESDAAVVAGELLRALVLGTADQLSESIERIRRRLDWCRARIEELNKEEERRGVLDEDQEALRRRCQRVVKRLLGTESRRSREQEGYDDRFTYSALAVEGFLPGYGLESGSIRANAPASRTGGGPGDFTLSRPPVTALRELVPGNLLYANGGQFGARFYHFEATDPVAFEVDVARGALRESAAAGNGGAAGLGGDTIRAVPICECDLSFRSHIHDEEDHRFQMPVATYGEELQRHGGGAMYHWGGRELHHRRAQHLRMVNIGELNRVRDRRLGYPISIVGNQCRSPLASDRELEDFNQQMQERYGRPFEWMGFYTEVIADALLLQGAANRDEACSVLESLRAGMASVLEMEREDLEILVVARPGEDVVDGFLYDPMPGGSGLLDQACERWADVVAAAIRIAAECPAACARACVDCLQTFRNAFQHEFLDRQLAIRRLREWGSELRLASEIPQRLPAEAPRGDHQPAVPSEERLRGILQRAGLPEFQWQRGVSLGQPLGSTTPDATFVIEDGIELYIYVDGLSRGLHGDPATAARDRHIRGALRSRGHQVVEIPASHLEDRDSMARHIANIARWLLGPEEARRVREDPKWFEESS